MNKILLVALFAVLAAVLYFFFSAQPTSTEQEALAKCLAQKGWKMYGVEWCHWCIEEKKAFAGAFKYVNYVDCAGKGATECAEKQIESTPTWISPAGIAHVGFRTLQQLRELSGCA